MRIIFHWVWRKVFNKVSLGIAFIPIALVVICLLALMFSVLGEILCVSWNITLPTMFGLPKITFWQSIAIFYIVLIIKSSYSSDYCWFKRWFVNNTTLPAPLFAVLMLIIMTIVESALFKLFWNISISNLISVNKMSMLHAIMLVITTHLLRTDFTSFKFKESTVTVLITILTFFLTNVVTMYSWNNIVPYLLNLELSKINYLQAFAFAFLINFVASISEKQTEVAAEDEATTEDEVAAEDKKTAEDETTAKDEVAAKDETTAEDKKTADGETTAEGETTADGETTAEDEAS